MIVVNKQDQSADNKQQIKFNSSNKTNKMEGTLYKINNEWIVSHSDKDDGSFTPTLPLLPSDVSNVTDTGKVDFLLHAEYVEELNPPYKIYAKLNNQNIQP